LEVAERELPVAIAVTSILEVTERELPVAVAATSILEVTERELPIAVAAIGAIPNVILDDKGWPYIFETAHFLRTGDLSCFMQRIRKSAYFPRLRLPLD